MKMQRTARFGLAIAALLLSASALADWKYYETKKYGFSMLVPEGASLSTREYGGGWGGISGSSEGVKFHGQAKLGAKESNEDIEKYAVNLIGVPASAWVKTDQDLRVLPPRAVPHGADEHPKHMIMVRIQFARRRREGDQPA